MELNARAKSISIDYETGDTLITFATCRKPSEIEDGWLKLKSKNLNINIQEQSMRRGPNANKYFHKLVSMIADVMGLTKAEVKNEMITSYGQPLLIDDAPQIIKTNIPVEFMKQMESMHCKPCGCKVENGVEVTFYRVYRGSHEYTTKEMSVLISGTVQEAHDLGIETMPDEQLQRLIERWHA